MSGRHARTGLLRRLNFRAPWACCAACRQHLGWHDAALCTEIRAAVAWLAAARDA